MPTYEYQCQNCGHYMEEFQKINDAPLIKCPECGKKKLQKQVSASAFHLKGGGWYVTDFKDKEQKDKEQKTDDSTKTEETSAKTEKKSETEVKSDKTKAAKPPKKETKTKSKNQG